MLSAAAVFWWVLPAAFLLDLVLGDPRRLPHPVRWMGNAITFFEPRFRRLPVGLTLSGALFAAALILGTWTLTWTAVAAARSIHPLLSTGLEIVIVYYVISARSLETAAAGVHRSLAEDNLAQARYNVSMIVGRDTTRLTRRGVTRAAVETVAENLVDGVVSPIFYAALGGAPLAMAYKMINTLDSMVGYKNDTYRLFGKTAARIDDAANFIPARLAVPVICLAAQILNGKGARALRTAWAEGSHHTSPNAGYSEGAFAGALGIRLIGPAVYHGRWVEKPYIGKEFGDTRLSDICRACDLMLLAALLWVIFSTLTRAMVA